MKKKKSLKFLISCILILFCKNIFAIGNESDIVLPSLSTVIESKTEKVEESDFPSFKNNTNEAKESSKLPSIEDSQTKLPSMNATEKKSNDAKSENITSTQILNENLRVEGIVGGGFPVSFLGDIGIFHNKENNPFMIHFNHETVNGYAAHSLSDGFFDTATSLDTSKIITRKNSKTTWKGLFYIDEDGLQNNSKYFTSLSKQLLNGGVENTWYLPKGFSLTGNVNMSWYMRYAKISSGVNVLDEDKQSSNYNFIAKANALWTNEQWSENIWTLSFLGDYKFISNLGNSDCIKGYNNSLTEKNTHRGYFGTSAEWKNEKLKFFGNVGAVVGSATNNNPALVPFSLGMDLDFKYVNVFLEGGLDSYQALWSNLEKRYKYSSLVFIPSETSDWYAKANFSVPVKAFKFEVSSEYRKTAFGNGIWIPNYKKEDVDLYGFIQKERDFLVTDSSASFTFGYFTFGASWIANWLYIPVLESEQNIKLLLKVESENQKFGVEGTFLFPLGSDTDLHPNIDILAHWSVLKSMSLVLKASDVVKLVSGTSRKYEGKYIQRSGTASIFVKFTF